MSNLEKSNRSRCELYDFSDEFLDDENHSTIITINNSTTCIEKSLKRWDKHQFKIVVEATGSYSSKILYYAYSMGFEVYQVSGLSIKSFQK